MVELLASKAKAASRTLASTSLDARNRALEAMANALSASAERIFAANTRDLEAARKEGLDAPLMARLSLDAKKLAGLVDGLRSLQALPDPVGKLQLCTELAPGLVLERRSCPLGLIGIVFESRPDALVQIASLCLKSGNACLLKGGREALCTNRELAAVLSEATTSAGMPEGWMALLETRDDVSAMLSLDNYIDLIIPRGSNAFVRHIQENTRIPVMGHSSGICHLYVDESADVKQAVEIAVDAKTQAPATCNTIETLLVHRAIAESFLPAVQSALSAKGVELLGCTRTRAIIPCEMATSEDWDTEYLDLKLSIKVVDSIAEAIEHINKHGSHHTDAIATNSPAAAIAFQSGVDSADVFVNCSTRFADGFRFGLGAEVGIATGKTHARGPVGLDGLVSYKYLLSGSGHTVGPFANGEKTFTHIPLK